MLEFPSTSMYLLSTEYEFNDFFNYFLCNSFGIQLIELLPYIQFISTFLIIQLDYDLPTSVKVNREKILEVHFLYIRINL